jgi:hypothetical protein
MGPRRIAGGAAALLGVVFATAGAGQGLPPDLVPVAGAWDLALDGSNRRCRVTLSADALGLGRALRFPAGCRRALPVLGPLTAWTAPERGTVALVTEGGQTVLTFRRNADDVLTAKAESGELYRLERQERAAVRLPPPPPLGVPQVTPVDPDKAPPLATLPGRYSLDRYLEHDVCRVTLSPALLSNDGRYEARIEEGCRDPGIQAFDPVSWRYVGGRLMLTARKGHEVTLVSVKDGLWRRDPEVGVVLVLKKVP